MSAPQAVDVQDMLCAQALALVAQALERLPSGATLDVRYNAQDVQRDLLAWAKGLGHPAERSGSGTLCIRKR